MSGLVSGLVSPLCAFSRCQCGQAGGPGDSPEWGGGSEGGGGETVSSEEVNMADSEALF